MPTRFIKESARTSKNLSAVSDFSERLFWRLVTTADDFGRFLACAAIVKSTCFPLSETMKSAQVEHALQDIASHELIHLYEVGDRRYGWFVNWERHQGGPRAKSSKYPDPLHLQASASICMHTQVVPDNPASAPNTDTDTDTDLSSLSSSDSEFEQFWSCYPKKVGKIAAKKAWDKAKNRPAIDVILASLERAKASEQWQREPPRFIPNPTTWLNEGRWDDQVNPTRNSTKRPPPLPPKNDPIARGLWKRTYGDPKAHGYE